MEELLKGLGEFGPIGVLCGYLIYEKAMDRAERKRGVSNGGSSLVAQGSNGNTLLWRLTQVENRLTEGFRDIAKKMDETRKEQRDLSVEFTTLKTELKGLE